MKRHLFLLFLLPLVLLLACQNEAPLPTVVPVANQTTGDGLVPPVVSNEPIVLPTQTAVPVPTIPDEPLAALVNNEPLTWATFEAELARYQQAQAELGIPEDGDIDQVVLDALIEQLLIRQAAAAQGIVVTDQMVDQKMAELESAAKSAENFTAWLDANRYTEAEFRTAVADGLIQEQMVSIVTTDVPFAAEQVHARYIQVDDATLASTLLAQVQNGDDFAILAQLHSLDRVTGENGGDLDFFAQGTLLVPEVEAAAFALTEPGAVSEVISAVKREGNPVYYLVQLIEGDAERSLEDQARSVLM